jgi:hypothetical protein
MRSISSLIAAVLVLSCSPNKQREQSAELRELVDLEGALNAVSSSPAEDRARRLRDVEELEISSPRVREARAHCVEGYRAFLDATRRMEEARAQVGRIEAEAAKALAGPVDLDASAGELAALHASAVTATEELGQALDRAERKVRECTEKRAALAAELGAE